MRIRQFFRSVSASLIRLGAALLKAVVTSMVLVVFVISIMHYMGVPLPDVDLLRGVSKLAHILS